MQNDQGKQHDRRFLRQQRQNIEQHGKSTRASGLSTVKIEEEGGNEDDGEERIGNPGNPGNALDERRVQSENQGGDGGGIAAPGEAIREHEHQRGGGGMHQDSGGMPAGG